MSSPNSPLNKMMLERTAASYPIIYLVNQLFIAHNDIIELGWLEREFYATDQTKFDGVLFKVGNKSISPALIEFSGGPNDKTPSRKNSKDIEKLYRNMIKVMNDTKTDRMMCMRCYGNNMLYLTPVILYSRPLFCNRSSYPLRKTY
jgi:hypothetical protein